MMRFLAQIKLPALSALVMLAVATSCRAGVKTEDGGISDAQFGRLLTVFLEDPLEPKAKEIAKLLIAFTLQTPKAAVVLGKDEFKWMGDKEDGRSLLLFAAYASGNTRSQLLSGIKQNDRYSGLITLFSVYRRLQAKDDKFKIAEVDRLRELQQQGKLLAHIVAMEKDSPTRISPEDAKKIEELRKKEQKKE